MRVEILGRFYKNPADEESQQRGHRERETGTEGRSQPACEQSKVAHE